MSIPLTKLKSLLVRLWFEVFKFLDFLIWYLRRKAGSNFGRFETAKGWVVDLLVARRGAYQRPFIHFGMMLIIGAAVVGAPLLADKYPTLGAGEEEIESPSAVLNTLTAQTIPTVTEKSDKPRDKVVYYLVAAGDTLSEIADKFGVCSDAIRWLNNFKSDKLMPNQEVLIPPVCGVIYTVKSGDTIYSIAGKYYGQEPEAQAQKIVNWPFNEFLDDEKFTLLAGQDLVIPDGVPPKEKPAPPLRPVPSEMLAGGSGQLAWPVGGQISQYPVWYHNALDIANKSGPGIASAETGTVIAVEFLRYGYGNHLIIDHGNGLQTLYAHLSEIHVKSGEAVSRGEIIAKMGSTGRSSGTHLHFEVRDNGKIVNPLPYLK